MICTRILFSLKAAIEDIEVGAVVVELVRFERQIVATNEVNGETKIASEEQRQKEETNDGRANAGFFRKELRMKGGEGGRERVEGDGFW